MPSAPILADINVDGRAIKAVAQLEQAGLALRLRSRHRPAGVADRGTARAAVRRAGREDVARHSRIRPSRRAYARNFFKVPDDVIDFTPELRAQALENLKRYKHSASVVHAADPGQRQRPARHDWRRLTATNWPGGGYDPETHIVYAPAAESRVAVARRGRLRDSRTSGTSRASPAGRSWKSSGPATAAPPMRGAETRDELPQRATPAARRRGAAPAAPPAPGGRPDRPGTSDRQAAVRRPRGDRSGSRRDRSGRRRTAIRRTTSAIIRRSRD